MFYIHCHSNTNAQSLTPTNLLIFLLQPEPLLRKHKLCSLMSTSCGYVEHLSISKQWLPAITQALKPAPPNKKRDVHWNLLHFQNN